MGGTFHDRRGTQQVNIADCYLIGIDISDNGDESVLTVSRVDGPKRTVINTFMGEEAKWMYERLTNQKLGVKQNGQ